MSEVELGIYRHYKGGIYRVVGIGTHTESKEKMVIYKTEGGDELDVWLRPLAMFIEDVEVDGKKQPRFKKIS